MGAMSLQDEIRLRLQETAQGAQALEEQIPQIARMVDILFDAWQNRRAVFLIGNGGSASTATHFASDLAKTVNMDPEAYGIRAMALSDNIPLASALTNDWGWENLYVAQLRTFADPKSVVIGFSVHGGSGTDKAGAWSQNLLKGLQYAKDQGMATIGFFGYDGGPMKTLVDVCVVAPGNSTPHVESFHVTLAHIMTFALRDRIAEFRAHA